MNSFPSGVISATLSPLGSDLSVDVPKLIKHCQWLLDNGSAGIAMLGTTGEANSFDLSERMSLLEDVARSGLPLEKIMVGTGCTAYTDTVKLTQHAVDLGMPNILLLPPYYYKQVNDEGLHDYFELVINQINRDALQIYLYHFPKMSGINFSVDFIAELVQKYPDSIVGMKDSSGDVDNMLKVCRRLPGFRLYAGTERYLLDVLRAGGAGCISATANVTIRKAAHVYRAWLENGEAHKLQDELNSIRGAFEGLPFSATLKQYLAHVRQDSDWMNIRPPNSLVTDDKIQSLIRGLEELDFSLDN